MVMCPSLPGTESCCFSCASWPTPPRPYVRRGRRHPSPMHDMARHLCVVGERNHNVVQVEMYGAMTLNVLDCRLGRVCLARGYVTLGRRRANCIHSGVSVLSHLGVPYEWCSSNRRWVLGLPEVAQRPMGLFHACPLQIRLAVGSFILGVKDISVNYLFNKLPILYNINII